MLSDVNSSVNNSKSNKDFVTKNRCKWYKNRKNKRRYFEIIKRRYNS